jgi:Uma2 family endonuclease
MKAGRQELLPMIDKIEEQTATIKLPYSTPSGKIVALNVSAEDYMEKYAEHFYEWREGVVYKISPVSAKHDDIAGYLRELFRSYFVLRAIGTVKSAPFVMKLGKSRREPDLQVILKDGSAKIEETFTDGAADICIEIVSLSNEGTDYGDKLREYEAGGVREYWIIDPLRKECRFQRLSSEGLYKLVIPEEDIYSSPLLPDFRLDTAIFWLMEMPNIFEVAEMVKKMLGEA